MIPATTSNTEAPTANRTASMPRAFKASARERFPGISMAVPIKSPPPPAMKQQETSITPCRDETERAEKKKDEASGRRVTPGVTERLRKIACKELPNALSALRVGAI